MLLPNSVNISTEIRLLNRVNMPCFCTNLWYIDTLWEHASECMLTLLGSRVAQEMNFNHQKLKERIIFRFLTYTKMLSMIIIYKYYFLSVSDRVPLTKLHKRIQNSKNFSATRSSGFPQSLPKLTLTYTRSSAEFGLTWVLDYTPQTYSK